MTETPAAPSWIDRVGLLAPGVPALLRYRPEDLPHDLVAGLSVAAVALPVGVAYAQLAGFDPVIGLYSSMLPLVAYALFGTSRQLVMGPDAATCALVAAAVAPLAGGDPATYLSLSMALALAAGLICIAASFLRLGALADFLSRPILVGFLNGIAIHIVLGQVGKVFGFDLSAPGIIPRGIEFLGKVGQTHWPTFWVGAATVLALILAPRILPRFPAALIAIVVAAAVVALLGLDSQGVATVGAVPAGLPALRLPGIDPALLDEVLAAAAGIALMSFTSAMLTARGFAAKNRYEIDVDREFSALGAANIASAISQGFAISGADSRTAMADAAGGRTQVAGLVSALAIALVLVFLTEPLKYVPIAALAAVLIKASLSLMDLRTLRELYRLDKKELALSVLATGGVIWVGAIDAILVAVVLALLRFVHTVARPKAETLGLVEGLPGFHQVGDYPQVKTASGLVLWRFNAPVVFFNAAYFKREALKVVEAAGPGLNWLVIDALPIAEVDVTGGYAFHELHQELARRGIRLVVAGRRSEVLRSLRRRDVSEGQLADVHVATLRQAWRQYRAAFGPDGRPRPPAPPPAAPEAPVPESGP
jgi:high affinity sulfate transporter 1